MEYKPLNYLIKVTADYVQPKPQNKQVMQNLINEFFSLNFFPKVQEEKTFSFPMDGSAPQHIINQVLGFISIDNKWIINFPPDGIEIIYNANLEDRSNEINSENFLIQAKEYFDLLIKFIEVASYKRIGFVCNEISEDFNTDDITNIFSENLGHDVIEMQKNVVTRVMKNNIQFNVLKNNGYFAEGKINFIGGVKDFKGVIQMFDINTNLDSFNTNIIDTIKVLSLEI
ncbi:hypothetical protein OHV35_05210 [Acinetobacter baumannii]|uniref:hypothetical protein n=1 Tax=Acinetobacter baumannii TaxID=470 RepID=UPI00234248EC|nr:hypothetical protein [Acinetobacter baumannii]MDC4442816.1 hypothetical protein [Acinetobacter baumannii]MDH2495254.1 hypothetical protein [Acinetobacter baumannii]MDO7332595.1 hypothetical protein [Acinetobacter baumannii]HCJ7824939.1 hypothetical protein [Acinetobacter baumannii]